MPSKYILMKKKVFDITHLHGNANQNLKDISAHPSQNG